MHNLFFLDSCVNSDWKVTAEHLKKTAYLYIRNRFILHEGVI